VERVFTDAENETVALLVDTGAVEWLTDGDFRAIWRLDEDHGLIEAAEDDHEEAAETVQREFAVVAPKATLDGKNEAGQLRLPPAATARVTGDTTLAPGTEVRVRLDLATSGLELAETTVTEAQRFAASFNLSTVPVGTNLTVTVSKSGRELTDPVDGSIVGDSKTTGTEASPEQTSAVTTTAASSTSTRGTTQDETAVQTRGPTTDHVPPTATQSPSPTGTATDAPGFGWLPVLVALGLVGLVVRE
jgi:hypothetical protein